MWSEAEIQDAARNWRAVADGYAAMPGLVDEAGRGLAEGYASALEMVLRPSRAEGGSIES